MGMIHVHRQSTEQLQIDIQTVGRGRGGIRIYPCSEIGSAWLRENFKEDYPPSNYARSNIYVERERLGLIIRKTKQANLVLRPLSALVVDIASEFHGYQVHYFPVSDRGLTWLRRNMPDDPWYNGCYRLPHTEAGIAFRLIAQAGLWVS